MKKSPEFRPQNGNAKPLKAALYERVSTTGQHIENQTPDLLLAIERDGGTLASGLQYVEEVSAYNPKAKRTALDRLLSDASRGKLKGVTLYFWSLSRLSRRGVKHTLDVLHHLKQCGVSVRSVTETWLDTRNENPLAELLIAIFSALAHLESVKKSEATKAGIARVRRAGIVRLGRPPVELDLRRILEMRAQGKSLRAVAKATGCSHRTILRALQGGAKSSEGIPPQNTSRTA